jgi:C4-dicarboxylate-specific signal transduction histidine kinase
MSTNLKMIEKETQRCKTINENLLKFARQEKLMEPTQINAVRGRHGDRPPSARAQPGEARQGSRARPASRYGNGNQLQVLINLRVNAQQAMKGTPGRSR